MSFDGVPWEYPMDPGPDVRLRGNGPYLAFAKDDPAWVGLEYWSGDVTPLVMLGIDGSAREYLTEDRGTAPDSDEAVLMTEYQYLPGEPSADVKPSSEFLVVGWESRYLCSVEVPLVAEIATPLPLAPGIELTSVSVDGDKLGLELVQTNETPWTRKDLESKLREIIRRSGGLDPEGLEELLARNGTPAGMDLRNGVGRDAQGLPITRRSLGRSLPQWSQDGNGAFVQTLEFTNHSDQPTASFSFDLFWLEFRGRRIQLGDR